MHHGLILILLCNQHLNQHFKYCSSCLQTCIIWSLLCLFQYDFKTNQPDKYISYNPNCPNNFFCAHWTPSGSIYHKLITINVASAVFFFFVFFYQMLFSLPGAESISVYEDVLRSVRYRLAKGSARFERRFRLSCSEMNGRYTSNELTLEVRPRRLKTAFQGSQSRLSL